MKSLNTHATVWWTCTECFCQRCETRREKPEVSVLQAKLMFFQGPLDSASFTRCQQSMCESNNQDQRAIGLYGLSITQNLKHSFSAQSTDRVSSLAVAPKIVNLHKVFYSLKAGKCQSQRSTRLDHTTLLVCGSSLCHTLREHQGPRKMKRRKQPWQTTAAPFSSHWAEVSYSESYHRDVHPSSPAV